MRDTPQTPPPAYRLSYSSEDDTLIVQISGEVDAQSVRMAYWREIVDTAAARNCRKLLVTTRKKGRPATPDELAELTRVFAADGARFDRIAVIEPTAEFIAAVEHGEILARAAGINLRIFGDRKSAEHWLHYVSSES